jgi:hypothetical protein
MQINSINNSPSFGRVPGYIASLQPIDKAAAKKAMQYLTEVINKRPASYYETVPLMGRHKGTFRMLSEGYSFDEINAYHKSHF